MNREESIRRLEELRTRVLNDLVGVVDQLSDDDAINFEGLLAIARSSGRVEFLAKALDRSERLPDPATRASAFRDVLDEVEMQLAELTEPMDEGSTENSQENNPDVTPANPQ